MGGRSFTVGRWLIGLGIVGMMSVFAQDSSTPAEARTAPVLMFAASLVLALLGAFRIERAQAQHRADRLKGPGMWDVRR
jgi:hypothetical protein